VTFIDSSQTALSACRQLVTSDYAEDRFHIVHDDALRFLRNCASKKEAYDIVAVDPPDLIPNRKSVGPGRKHYINVYQAALGVVAPGGFAVLSCCSYHLPESEFEQVVAQAVRRARRAANMVWRGGAAPDHPRPVAMPESHYLKCVALQLA
jgi:23S rRNA (cytosine1962-C5)-methyltransferase